MTKPLSSFVRTKAVFAFAGYARSSQRAKASSPPPNTLRSMYSSLPSQPSRRPLSEYCQNELCPHESGFLVRRLCLFQPTGKVLFPAAKHVEVDVFLLALIALQTTFVRILSERTLSARKRFSRLRAMPCLLYTSPFLLALAFFRAALGDG